MNKEGIAGKKGNAEKGSVWKCAFSGNQGCVLIPFYICF